MSKISPLHWKTLEKVFCSCGFRFIRQKGSHRFFQHFDGRKVTVPIHSNKDIGRGLLKAILEEIGMAREEFFERYK